MPWKDPEKERASAIEICSELLRMRLRIRAEGRYSHAHDRHFKELVSITLWKHSEADGKYLGCPYWSTGAIESLKRHGRVVTNARQYPDDALRHEHLFPRGQMTDLLFQLEDPSPEGVRELMDRLNVGVVVTVREDARLPADGDAADPWRRYASAGITWVDKRSEQLPPSHGRSGVSTPGSSSISDESLIEVLVKANPKREGSRSHAIFQRMMDAAAQAIQEGRMLTVEEARRVGYRSIDLKWDSDPERGAPTETGAHIRILKP